MGKPSLTARLAGLQQCGCTDTQYCPQHWQLLTTAERLAHHRRPADERARRIGGTS